jgi:hypothetical protein
VLAAHDATLCLADRRGRPITPLWRTATWGYLRFHEGTAQPWPSYGPQALRSWVARLSAAWPDEADVFVYFNNDQGGAAVINSARFARLARAAGRTVTRTPLPAQPAGPRFAEHAAGRRGPGGAAPALPADVAAGQGNQRRPGRPAPPLARPARRGTVG